MGAIEGVSAVKNGVFFDATNMEAMADFIGSALYYGHEIESTQTMTGWIVSIVLKRPYHPDPQRGTTR